jgi:transcription initiation factor TFIID subunit 5
MAETAPRTSPAALDNFVLQHLRSRGFTEAAAALQSELHQRALPEGTAADATRPALVQLLVSTMRLKYSYEAVRDWVDSSLEAFKPELRRVLFPFFVHCYLELMEASQVEEAATLLQVRALGVRVAAPVRAGRRAPELARAHHAPPLD